MPPQALTPKRGLQLFRLLLATILLASAATFIVATWHWPLVGDAPLFHYIVSLLHRGQAPYRDFADINLPGTYALQAAVIALLGPGPRAFRLFDLGLLAAIAAAMFALARANAPAGRKAAAVFPALFAATLFALIHGRDGIIEQGQRDLVLAALFLAACATLIQAIQTGPTQKARHLDRSGEQFDRSPRSGETPQTYIASEPDSSSVTVKTPAFRFGLALTGLLLGFACAIKPSALLLVPPILALLAHELRKQHRPWRTPLATCASATLVAPLLTLAYLIRQHALPAFWQTLTHLMPYHASLQRLSPHTLILGAVSSVCLPLFLLWLAVFLGERRYTRTLDRLLLLGFLVGIASYILQGRGYPYHRYPSEAFLLLLAALAFTDALWFPNALWFPDALWPTQPAPPTPPWVRIAAAAGLALGALFLVPRSLQLVLRYDPHDQYTADLRASLQTQGGPILDHRLQCLDDYAGCLNTLQQMHLIQSTGFLYDCYLYTTPEPSARFLDQRNRYRQAFQQALLDHPPELIVVSSHECGGPPDYKYLKLTRWPWLQHHLDTQYRLVEDHIPSDPVRWGGKPVPPYGFRLYRLTH